MGETFEALKTACALVEGKRQGTGYLVHPRYVATAFHVVEGDTTVRVTFGDGGASVSAKVCEGGSSATDCALLELEQPLEGVTPLPLASALTKRTTWSGYGFPGLTHGSGVPIEGAVLDPNGQDDKGARALLLQSPLAAAGNASPLGGFSGGPVIVDGAVVGQLRKVIGDPDDNRRPAYGVLYASPVAEVHKLLATFVAVSSPRPIEPPTPSPPPRAPIKADEYHVFVSYRSTDARFAKAIVERLEGAGLRVFFAPAEIQPGDHLTESLSRALDASRAAVVLVSKAWLASDWCRTELDALVHRSVRDKTFRLVPVRLDDSELPALTRDLVSVNFVRMEMPGGPELERLVYALAGEKLPPQGSVTSQVAAAVNDVVSDYIVRVNAATSWTQVVELAKTWKAMNLKDTAPVLAAARILIGMNRPANALEILADQGDGFLASQVRSFARALNSALDAAITELEVLWRQAPDDGEVGGLLAGRYKTKWADGQAPAYLPKARETYRRAFDLSNDPYPGINAATLALLSGDDADAAVTADKVRKLLENKTTLTHWDMATLAEASLIAKRFEMAREWYAKACGAAAALHRDRASMRWQVRRLLPKLGHERGELDAIFAIPRVVAFTGHRVDESDPQARLPAAKVGAVRLAIRAELTKLGNVHGFASAAAGADILFLEELLARDGTASVVLPFPENEFLAISTRGDRWIDRWEDIRSKVEIEVLEPQVPPAQDLDKSFERGNKTVKKKALDYARRLDEPVIPMVVWDGQEGRPGGTAEAVALWIEDGYEKSLIHIDIRKL